LVVERVVWKTKSEMRRFCYLFHDCG
jgi:hypothetical protein